MNKARYELADEIVFRSLPRWNQLAILEDRKNKVDSRYMQEFARKVVELAESNTELSAKPVKKKRVVQTNVTATANNS